MSSYRRAKRPGFTLIESVVVVILLLILIGVLLPAVQQVSIPRVRMATVNNLRQLVIAAHNCHDTYKKFAPYYGFYPSSRVNPGINVQRAQQSMFTHLLPYIDGHTIYNAFDAGGSPPIILGIRPPAFQSYMSPLDATASDGTNGTEGVTSYLANQRAFCENPAAPAPSTYSCMPGSFKAGTSNCVFFVTAVGVPEERTAHIWTARTAWFADKDGITLPLPLPAAPAKPVAQQPYQLTPGGSQVSMGDASTRSVSPNILPAIWARVCNPATKDGIPNDWDQ